MMRPATDRVSTHEAQVAPKEVASIAIFELPYLDIITEKELCVSAPFYQDRLPQGRGSRAPMDGFTACPDRRGLMLIGRLAATYPRNNRHKKAD